MYDKDGSGTIELSEMVEVLETVYVMEGVMTGNMAQTRAKQIFQELDVNGDGSLTCDEFIKGCMKDEEMVSLLKQKDPSVTGDEDGNPESASRRNTKKKKKRAANSH